MKNGGNAFQAATDALRKAFLVGGYIYNKVYEAQFDPTLLYIFIDNYEVRRGFIFVKKL